MSHRILKHSDFLQRVLQNPNAVNSSKPDEIACLVEIAYNVCRSNPLLPFSRDEIKILKQNLPSLCEFSKIRDSKTARKVFKTLPGDVRYTLISSTLSILE